METSVNNKCRAFTSLEQSKKLAEILSLESADMWWLYVSSQGKYIAMMFEEPDPHYLARMESCGIKDAAIRCWSLAALLAVLPEKYTELIKEGGMYRIIIKDSYMTCLFDNPVDACVAMVEKLHESKML